MSRQVKRISDLPEAAPAQGDDLFETVQDGENKKATVGQVAGYAVATHVAQSDPHPQYTTVADVAQAISSTDLGDLANVDTTGALSGDALVFDGDDWVPGEAGAVDS